MIEPVIVVTPVAVTDCVVAALIAISSAAVAVESAVNVTRKLSS